MYLRANVCVHMLCLALPFLASCATRRSSDRLTFCTQRATAAVSRVSLCLCLDHFCVSFSSRLSPGPNVRFSMSPSVRADASQQTRTRGGGVGEGHGWLFARLCVLVCVASFVSPLFCAPCCRRVLLFLGWVVGARLVRVLLSCTSRPSVHLIRFASPRLAHRGHFITLQRAVLCFFAVLCECLCVRRGQWGEQNVVPLTSRLHHHLPLARRRRRGRGAR